ncbi:hypothetical protein ES707_19079 [subsurface metagenome]
MVSIKVDGKNLEVPEGSYLLQAAKMAGLDIPALCHYEGLEHFTSCMVCIVKDVVTGRLLPSCSVLAEEGMDIVTFDEEIFQTRKAALELLLSNHTGDCQAPCQMACPAHMDIPLMNRLLEEGKVDEAIRVIDRDIPIPSVLGRICHAPCEGACRRGTIDEPVSVCLLKRYAGDFGKRIKHGKGPKSKTSGTGKVAVIGAGPAGLSAGYYLQRMGYQVILFDRNDRAGGLLYEARPGEDHYRDALEREVRHILETGIQFRPGTDVDKNIFTEILNGHDALVLATGEMEEQQRMWGIEPGKSGFNINRATYETSAEKVFAIGNAVRPVRSAVRSVGHGKEAAVSVDQYFKGKDVTGYPKNFNSRFGRLLEEEFAEYLKESVPDERFQPEKGEQEGYGMDEVRAEASRCMHCDCRDIHTCKLRVFSQNHNADQQRFKRETRRPVSKVMIHETVIYEPSKCINCGICVRLTEQNREKYGFTFIGRGFDVRIGIPFDEKLGKELSGLAEKTAMACPTGALSKITED